MMDLATVPFPQGKLCITTLSGKGSFWGTSAYGSVCWVLCEPTVVGNHTHLGDQSCATLLGLQD